MSDSEIARAYFEAEIEGLEPFDFVTFSPATNVLHSLEVNRREDLGLEIHVPGRPTPLPPLPVEMRSRLRERGFVSLDPADQGQPWTQEVADAGAAFRMLRGLLGDVFGEKSDVPLNVIHGTRRIQHEAEIKSEEINTHIEQVLTDLIEEKPERDEDGDFRFPLGDVTVMVGTRIGPDGLVMVKIFAITNVDVTISPELGLFLARLNFGLMFGRFALNTERRSIWFDETLLGDHFSDEELRFAVRIVATTADEWDDRLKGMFGGSTNQEVLRQRLQDEHGEHKPGHGVYL